MKPYHASYHSANSCVQCGEFLETYVDEFDYCTNPACPNFGLYQRGMENMPVESVLKKRHLRGNYEPTKTP